MKAGKTLLLEPKMKVFFLVQRGLAFLKSPILSFPDLTGLLKDLCNHYGGKGDESHLQKTKAARSLKSRDVSEKGC